MSTAADGSAAYREVQRFSQVWIWVLIILSSLVLLGIFGYGAVTQLILGRPFGDPPMPDWLLAVLVAFSALVAVVMPCLFRAVKLVTEVRDDGLYVQFFPLRVRRIAFADIEQCEARTYRPLWEYGGWGIRWGFHGKAYNVSGNRGVQLTLTGGKRLLIGSQQADELADAVRARMVR